MTLNEFKSWLDGYIQGGGKDINVVKKKVDEMYSEVTIVPYPTYPDPNPYYLPYVTSDDGSYV